MRRLRLGLALLLLAVRCAAIEVPAPPDIPTEASCRAWSQALYANLHETYEQWRECSKGPPNIGPGRSCDELNYRVKPRALMAWPQCEGNAEVQCQLYSAIHDSGQCLAAARAEKQRADEKVRLLEQAEKQYTEAKKLITSPSEFFAEKILSRVSPDVASMVWDPERKQLSQRGASYMDDTYRYLLDQYAKRDVLRSSNPIIGSIQGAAAAEVRRSVQVTMGQLDGALSTMQSIGKELQSSPGGGGQRPVSRGAATGDCAVLDSDARQDLALEDPDGYEALVQRCRKK